MVIPSETFQLDRKTVNSCKEWVRKKVEKKWILYRKQKQPFSCRLLALKIGSRPNQQKIIYIEENDSRPNYFRGYVFIEEDIDLIDYSEASYCKPVYRKCNTIIVDELAKKIEIIGNEDVSTLHSINTKQEFVEFIRFMRKAYKKDFFHFDVNISMENFLKEFKKSQVINSIKTHIIKYDLHNKEILDSLGSLPDNISITIVPFQEYASQYIYIYNNAKPYRVIRYIKLNANGLFDEIQSLQSPGAVNNPEIQWLDYRYNSDGGPTLYESEKGFFDYIENNGIKITIPYIRNRTKSSDQNHHPVTPLIPTG